MDARKWLQLFFIEIAGFMVVVSLIVIVVDPFFHYHKPIGCMFYTLNNQRSQNDGIIKHFEYNSIIIGTSMCENFKSSEFNKIFHANSIKVCFSGGSYKEINDNLKTAFDSENEIKYVLRCLDYERIINDKDIMIFDLGSYPTYLYDKNPFNDVKYILNKEIIFNICIPMLINLHYSKEGGITSFDKYSNWNADSTFGAKEVLGGRKEYTKAESEIIFTENDAKILRDNIEQNVIRLAEDHPETTFYYFFSPYSIAYWGGLYENGTLNRQVDAEKVAIEQILKCKNIELYSFNDHWDITTNLDNYKDICHYGEWINTEILQMIHQGVGLLTQENYEEYINRERNYYMNYSYQFYTDEE